MRDARRPLTYHAGSTPLHKLHPAVKLAWLLWITIAVFITGSVLLPVSAAAAAILTLWSIGLPPRRLPAARLWASICVLIMIVHAFIVRDGTPVLGPVTTGGLLSGLRAIGRLLAVLLWSMAFVVTTEPSLLAHALMKIGLPYRWGFALTTALRLAPVFRLEAHQVYLAQLVRGVAYDRGGWSRYWLMLRRMCLPLLVSAMRTAQSLSLSMEGRAFGLHTKRTYTRVIRTRSGDLVMLLLLLASVAAFTWIALAT